MNKPIIHFSHANGFPAKTYNKLFSYLEDDFEINYLERHAHNPKFPVADGWERLRDELREEIENRYAQKIIGVGHSLGGILHLLVAADAPELYKQIILLDAPVISRLSSAVIRFLKRANLLEKIPLVKTTRFRRSTWRTRDEAFEHFRQKEKFHKLDADVLRDYVRHGTIETETGVNLFFKPSVEAKIYQTLPDYLPKLRGKLKVPAAYIGGTRSTEARLARLNFMRRHFPFEFYFVEGSHLFPLEKPLETAQIIKKVTEKLI
ncbi:MAG: alpha/beta hydrolase [Acidobacteriota bacterium]|nr:alpha/beta hydrolase [Acidobacteriota bacterium]